MGLKHQAASARKWRAAIRRIETHLPVHLPPLLLLTDPNRFPDPAPMMKNLPEGSGVIYRHFGAEDRGLTAHRLKRLCQQQRLFFLVSSDPHLATQVGADGVHWPERLLPQSRRWRSRFALQTSSAHSRRAITCATRAGIDGILFSTVFPSDSPSASTPLGPTRFRRLSLTQKVPIYALGGIDAGRALRVAAYAGSATVSGFAGFNVD